MHYDRISIFWIARGTHNPQIIDFLTYLGQQIGPRLQLGYLISAAVTDEYFASIHEEHRSCRRSKGAMRAAPARQCAVT